MVETLKNVISFQATVDEEVEQDSVAITFGATETGSDAYAVQTALAARQEEALAIALPKESDTVEVKTGSFQIYPMYKDNVVTGYSGNFIIIVSGTDIDTIKGLTGEITSMTVSGVQQSVSPARRKEFEQDLALRAIERWREKASIYAGAFGNLAFTLINADVSVGGGGRYYPMAMSAKLETTGGQIDVEPGVETLTATVSGSIQLSYPNSLIA